MFGRIAFSLVVVSMLLSTPVMAREPGFFAGLDLSGVMTSGSSGTDNGGGFGGGGVVKNVDFDDAAGIGGHVGYRFNDAWSAFVSYQYVRGDVSWDAEFPGGSVTNFSGSATTNAILGNVAYGLALSSATTARITAGMGVSFNSLSGVVETAKIKDTSYFVSDVEDHTRTSLIAQLGLGLTHEITKNVVLGLDATVAYIGGFSTGDTRSGNLGVTDINPYKIDDVWRAGLGASVRVVF